MSDKGSDLRSKAEKDELMRTMAEFTEKLEVDPYQPGIEHPGLCGDDLQDIVDDVLIVREFQEMTVRIKKEPNGFTMSMEVIERKK